MGGRRKGLEVAEYYTQIARGYDELHGAEQRKKYSAGLNILKPSKKILDVGCGTALLSEQLDFLYYLGVDISEGMLRIAKKRRRGLMDLVRADAHALPLRSRSFKTCYSFTALQNLEEPGLGLKELKRVCENALVSSLRGKGLRGKDCVEVYPDVICII